MRVKGAVACGHPETARAAEVVLREGGNAFDAVIAAFLTSCVAEPVLASLGGGGFLLAHTQDHRDLVYDFFAHTPRRILPADELDFYPIHADFGTALQEFHIGVGSIAVPGAIKGVFKIHQDLGTMPVRELAQPAIEAARNGIELNELQAFIFRIISPILVATPEARQVYQSQLEPGELIKAGECIKQSHFADFLEVLVAEGDDLFYRGEVAQMVVDLCSKGGQLTRKDLEAYTVEIRQPVDMHYRDHRVLTNPAPSCGGTLIAFALNLLEHADIMNLERGSSKHLQMLVEVMKLTNEARLDQSASEAGEVAIHQLLNTRLLKTYRDRISKNVRALRGTTHMSVMDSHGNVAALTASNGEGCGHMIPDTGLMLNNMLGEEDLNTRGFYNWPADRRMTSMMAPTLVMSQDGRKLSLGSGGSNRLRTAILQVTSNIIDFGLPLHDAINQPRIHFENDLLNIEPGFDTDAINTVCKQSDKHKLWEQQNLFFGGVHAVSEHNGEYDGAGDARRGGVATVVN